MRDHAAAGRRAAHDRPQRPASLGEWQEVQAPLRRVTDHPGRAARSRCGAGIRRCSPSLVVSEVRVYEVMRAVKSV
jgi:hypothetical protein